MFCPVLRVTGVTNNTFISSGDINSSPDDLEKPERRAKHAPLNRKGKRLASFQNASVTIFAPTLPSVENNLAIDHGHYCVDAQDIRLRNGHDVLGKDREVGALAGLDGAQFIFGKRGVSGP